MGLLNLLGLPVLGPAQLVRWLASTVAEEVDRQAPDEQGIRTELLELQNQYELGSLDDQEYEREEEALLEQLRAVREIT